MPLVRVSPDGHELVAAVSRLLPPFERAPAAPSWSRVVLGLSGSPGCGKSTLAGALASAYDAAMVPMDGFHRTTDQLAQLGLLDIKGAPDTFDAEGYALLLRRLHSGRTVLAPAFDHRLPDPLPDRIEVPATARLVVTEGNYLLLAEPRWREVREQLDAVWHLITDAAVRRERLVARHIQAGRPPDDAHAWVDRVDEANAKLVEAAAGAADLVLDLTDWSGTLPAIPAPSRWPR